MCSYLRWVDLSLDDVKDGDVAVARLPLSPCGYHHVLGLQESPHHIQHCGFPDTSNLKHNMFTDSEVNMKTFWTICSFSTRADVIFPTEMSQLDFFFDHWSELTDWSVVSGVYPVIRKWRRGVGMSDAIRPIRSLFMYPG